MDTRRKLIFLLTFCVIASCDSKRVSQSSEVDDLHARETDTFLPENSKALLRPDKINIADLPFGSAVLYEHTFPENFKIGDVVSGDTSRTLHQSKIEEVSNWYSKMNHSHAGKAPPVDDTIFFDTPPYFQNLAILRNQIKLSLDSFRFELPRIAKYRCYYSFEGLCGDLVLYDTASRTATVLPVYYEREGEFEVLNRYFYITNDYEIKIYEARCGEEQCEIQHVRDIRIGDEGFVEVNHNNKQN